MFYLILQIINQWSIKHVPKKKNQVGDRIVKVTSNRIKDVHVFIDILKELGVDLCADKTNGFLLDD